MKERLVIAGRFLFGLAMGVFEELSVCEICAERFSATVTRHRPRPIVQGLPSARILIAGQAPGLRVYHSGVAFDDRSGDRLRCWLGVNRAQFYDPALFAIVPMAFCFPGYDVKGSDLAPPAICARVWRQRVLAQFENIQLTVLVGKYAHDWHLGHKMSVWSRVAEWESYAPSVFPLPHPSWRNTAWMRKHEWFENTVLPELRGRVQEVIG